VYLRVILHALRDMSASTPQTTQSRATTQLDSAAAPSATQIVRRTLHVNIKGSLANLAMAGPQGGMWKALSGKETAVFLPSLDEEMDPSHGVHYIRNAVVRNVTIKEHMSSFPYALGVTLSCVPPSEVTDLGQKYAYTVLPGSRLAVPQEVYSCDTSMQDGSMWRAQYSEWNSSNLESHGVMDVNGQPYVFVHLRHPIVGLLRHNADLIGCDIDKQPRMDDNWLKITRQVLSTCCQTLRKQVLSKMLTQDMNMFSMQLHRLDSDTWDDLGDGVSALQDFRPKAKWSTEEHEKEKEHHLREFVTKPYHYMARLQIEYEIPAQTQQ